MLVEEFETNVQSEFAGKYFFTLVRRCHNCLKRGSAAEIDLALQLIGLVALTLGEGDGVFVHCLFCWCQRFCRHGKINEFYMGIHESRKQTSIICGCFSNINLGEDDEHVNGASIEALALIFENGRLEKFSNQAEEYASIKDMKDRIMNEVKRICNGIKQDASKIIQDD
ncbi:hypothetical protein CQW23_20541 [Capsicum baccatum]|uniref:Interferon-related developmental regulator N-terminal domain-containing protein n=1 Tax=Capsicum baccatum TaxID=33114 RepID=A0A2G2W906_CAPBA|nr:hypothetical protein CQW23_20541 [Capsicum baccatum]